MHPQCPLERSSCITPVHLISHDPHLSAIIVHSTRIPMSHHHSRRRCLFVLDASFHTPRLFSSSPQRTDSLHVMPPHHVRMLPPSPLSPTHTLSFSSLSHLSLSPPFHTSTDQHPTTATASSASPQSSPPDCVCRILSSGRLLVVPASKPTC